jgi:hypothetical protein
MLEYQWIRIPNRPIPSFSSTEDGDVFHMPFCFINTW